MQDLKDIKDDILTKFKKALTMELPLRDIIAMGNVVAMFENNEHATPHEPPASDDTLV